MDFLTWYRGSLQTMGPQAVHHWTPGSHDLCNFSCMRVALGFPEGCINYPWKKWVFSIFQVIILLVSKQLLQKDRCKALAQLFENHLVFKASFKKIVLCYWKLMRKPLYAFICWTCAVKWNSAFLCGNCSFSSLFSIYSKLPGIRVEQAIQGTESFSSFLKSRGKKPILLRVCNVRHFTCNLS